MNRLPIEKRVRIIGMMVEGMSIRTISRLTNAFSRKVGRHVYARAIYFMDYNFVRIQQSHRVMAGMAAGVANRLREIEDIARLSNCPTTRLPRRENGR